MLVGVFVGVSDGVGVFVDIGPESSNRDSIVAIVELLKNTKFGKAVVVGV